MYFIFQFLTSVRSGGLICIVGLALCVGNSLAAELQVTKFEYDPNNALGELVQVKDADGYGCAVLIVYSDLEKGLRYNSTMGEFKRVDKGGGVFQFWVQRNDKKVTWTVDGGGFLPCGYTIPLRMEPKKVYRVDINSSGITPIRAKLTLRYKPSSPDEKIFGGLDGKVMLLDFSAGKIVLIPDPGNRTVKLNLNGVVWEKSYNLNIGDAVEDSVTFAGGRQENVKIADPGNLAIDSDPQGATVYLNKVEQGVTPFTMFELQPGTYQVDVVKDLYLQASKSVQVESNGFPTETFKLQPNFGRIRVNSDPSGATVWLDGKQAGVTPFEKPQYVTGRYPLRLSLSLYYETNDVVVLEPGDEYDKTFTLKPQFGSLTITSTPSCADVTIDGVSWGKTPVTRDKIPSSKLTVHLTLPNYFDSDESVTVRQPQSRTHYDPKLAG